jgi:hypothetical protein
LGSDRELRDRDGDRVEDPVPGRQTGAGVTAGEHHPEVRWIDRCRLDAHDDLIVGRLDDLGLADRQRDNTVVAEGRSEFECGDGKYG